MSVVEKLAYLKRKQKMNSEDLAECSGVPIGTLNKILSGATKNPALKNMYAIANTFNVPVRYLIDDSIPVDCDMKAFSEYEGLLNVTKDELELLSKYRRLPDHDRCTFELLLDDFLLRLPQEPAAAADRKLLCYVPVANGLRGTYGDALELKYLTAAPDPVSSQSDFAVMLTGQSMEPVYGAGTVLGVRRTMAKHNQLGVFLLNREGFIRKLYQRRDVHKLVATNVRLRDIPIREEDELRCLGVVVGALRSFRWV